MFVSPLKKWLCLSSSNSESIANKSKMNSIITIWPKILFIILMSELVGKSMCTAGSKGKPSSSTKQETDLCLELNNHRCSMENGELDLEILACDDIHKIVNKDQAALVCSTLENCKDDYSRWKCYSNGYPVHCWQCLRSDYTSRVIRNQQRYKHYNGELDSRGIPSQIHHSLKRMTMVSLGIDLCFGSVTLLLARRMSKGKGSPLAQYVVFATYLIYNFSINLHEAYMELFVN